MPKRKVRKSTLESELSGILAQEEEFQRYLFQVFTVVALTFLLVYAVLQAKAGQIGLAGLYTLAATIIASNSWAIHFHNKLVVAANVFVALGPVVLLPWQVTGGVAGTGLMWFPAYVVFAMFFVPGWGGSFWALFIYGASFFLLLFQLQGLVHLPYDQDAMLHFYFVGGVTYALAFYFLHAQRIAYDVLKLQLAALKLAQGSAPIGNWSWDIANNVIELCEQLRTSLGLSLDDKISYESYINLVHPDDRQLLQETLEEALLDHQPYSLIHRVKRADGTLVWIHGLGQVVLDVTGRPVRLFGTAQDITERMASQPAFTVNRKSHTSGPRI
jgi:PAS domain S-box-containing protein